MPERSIYNLSPDPEIILSNGLKKAPENFTPAEACKWVFLEYVRGENSVNLNPPALNGKNASTECKDQLFSIAKALSGIDPRNAQDALEIIQNTNTLSLEFFTEKSEGLSLIEKIPDPTTGTPFPSTFESLRHDLKQAMEEVLNGRERHVLQTRLENPGTTLADLGRELGVTRERIRQIEKKAKDKIRNSSHRNKLIEYLR